MNNQEVFRLLRSLGNFLSPIIYLFVWYFFLICVSKNIPSLSFNPDYFLFISFIIFSLSLITKSTVWSIGHEKFGLKGDSRSRIINFHKNDSGDFWFDLFADNPDLLKDQELRKFIKELTSNPS